MYRKFESYINALIDYIETRMKVSVYYELEEDALHICFIGTEQRLVINDVFKLYNQRWSECMIGAVGQELMRYIKAYWVDILMRKDD